MYYLKLLQKYLIDLYLRFIYLLYDITKERLNERELYLFVEWSCANKRNKSVGTLNSGRMVVHIASAKNPECEGSTSPSSFYGKLLEY